MKLLTGKTKHFLSPTRSKDCWQTIRASALLSSTGPISNRAKLKKHCAATGKYSIVGGFSFYQRAEVKDLLAYLKVALSPQDSLSLLRIINTPARGIGKGTIEQIERYALEHSLSLWHALPRILEEKILPVRAESAIRSFLNLIEELRESVRTKPLHETLREILEKTGYETMLKSETTPDAESRLGNLNELVNAAAEAAERGETASEFLDHAALVSDADAVDEQASVSLLTIHNAKGLEFPTVFLAGMEE